jgi:hypothetical protein
MLWRTLKTLILLSTLYMTNKYVFFCIQCSDQSNNCNLRLGFMFQNENQYKIRDQTNDNILTNASIQVSIQVSFVWYFSFQTYWKFLSFFFWERERERNPIYNCINSLLSRDQYLLSKAFALEPN